MINKDIEIHGHFEPEFKAVRDQFYKHFKQDKEIGASVSMTVGGNTVVDLWGGNTDRAGNTPWSKDTLATIFSGTKGLASLCALRLADQGKLDLEASISDYWPEFSYHGKSQIPVKWILSHKAGLVGTGKVLLPKTLYDNDALADSLAKQQPWWEPGEGHGYHAITMGWLMGKIVQNITGKSLGQYFREEIAQPLGLDLHIGLDPHEQYRVAKMYLISGLPDVHDDILNILKGAITEDKRGMTISAFLNPLTLGLHAVTNTKIWPRLEQPAANGMANARAMAKLYGVLANGGTADNGYQLLSPDMLAKCWEEQSSGMDLVLKRPTRFSYGFMMTQEGPLASYGPGSRSFGHVGMGGSLSFADPDSKTSFGYVMNKMGTYVLVDPRARSLIDTFYSCF